MPARKAANKGLPARWSIRRGKYYYEPPRGMEHCWDGKRLFPSGFSYQEALRAFADRMLPEPVAKGKTLADAIGRYLLEVSLKKAARSFINDQNNAAPLKRVFGKIKLKQQFDVSWCHQYIDTPRERYNAKGVLISTARAPVQARKEIAAPVRNPYAVCGVGLDPPQRAHRPVPSSAVHTAVARCHRGGQLKPSRGSPHHGLNAYVDLNNLLGIRQADMLQLQEADASEAGVMVEPSKTINSTGRRVLFTWTPALRTAWEAALAVRPGLNGLAKTRTDHLFQVRTGGPYDADSFGSTWQRVMAKAVAAGVPRFTEHDLRAFTAGESTTLAEAQQRLGHASPEVTRRVYRRRPEKVAPLR